MNVTTRDNAVCGGCGRSLVLVVEISTDGCFEPVEVCLDCLERARAVLIAAMPEGDRP